MAESYFVQPPTEVYTDPTQGTYIGSKRTYTHYNYLGNGPIARAKRARFELVLQAYLPRPGGTGVALDVGCADGVFLPSLARHFTRVVGIDIHPHMLATAGEVVRRLHLDNVKLILTTGKSTADVRDRAGDDLPADVAFLLETLEHVGTPGNPDPYGERAAFVDGLFDLLKPDGAVVISVPRMVGLTYLCKHLLQSTLRMAKEPVPLREVLRSGLLRDTERLEPTWDHGHRGFNDEKLSRALRQRFTVEKEFTTVIGRFFVVRRGAGER